MECDSNNSINYNMTEAISISGGRMDAEEEARKRKEKWEIWKMRNMKNVKIKNGILRKGQQKSTVSITSILSWLIDFSSICNGLNIVILLYYRIVDCRNPNSFLIDYTAALKEGDPDRQHRHWRIFAEWGGAKNQYNWSLSLLSLKMKQ